MVGAEIIWKYFPELSKNQRQKFEDLGQLYVEWNSRINLISRKDIENLYEKHILHSMGIGKWINFKPGSYIMDLGSGGGFPGVPLAILFPEVRFHLIDSIGKKIRVIQDISSQLSLDNIKSSHMRAEENKEKYDFVVTRAVSNILNLMQWTRNNYSHKHRNQVPNGLIALKGGDVLKEMGEIAKGEYLEVHSISKYFEEEFFNQKSLLYVQMS
jgi:16S rRNA (guanine527-N7)-methyltransferase